MSTVPTFIPQARNILESLAQLPLDSHEAETVAQFQREMHRLLMEEGFLLEDLTAAARYIESAVETRLIHEEVECATAKEEAAQAIARDNHARWMATKDKILRERYPEEFKVTELTLVPPKGDQGAA